VLRPRKRNVLVGKLKPKQSPDTATAEMVVEGVAGNAITTTEFEKSLRYS
jgi:hypothetical protein